MTTLGGPQSTDRRNRASGEVLLRVARSVRSSSAWARGAAGMRSVCHRVHQPHRTCSRHPQCRAGRERTQRPSREMSPHPAAADRRPVRLWRRAATDLGWEAPAGTRCTLLGLRLIPPRSAPPGVRGSGTWARCFSRGRTGWGSSIGATVAGWPAPTERWAERCRDAHRDPPEDNARRSGVRGRRVRRGDAPTTRRGDRSSGMVPSPRPRVSIATGGLAGCRSVRTARRGGEAVRATTRGGAANNSRTRA